MAAISRTLAVPRSTVRYWLGRCAGVAQWAEATGLKPVQWGFDSLHQHQLPAYAYLLGMYLGDGYIGRLPRSYSLRIFLHKQQLDIAAKVRAAILTLLPDHRVGYADHHGSAIAVTCYFRAWPLVFPQHGEGRKHARAIVLESWQRDIVVRHPEHFIGGCIDSDGSRHRRIVKGKNYPAYSFSNRSEDILGLFGWACDLIGIKWRRSSRVAISIARRGDVARLDSLLSYVTPASPVTPEPRD